MKCDILCHNEQTALMEPVLEEVEASVDVRRDAKGFDCAMTTTRLNINV